MRVLASAAALLAAYLSGVLQGWRWGREDGHKEADRLLKLGRESQ